MTFKEHFSRTIALSIPIIIGQLGHMAMGVVDNIMIGQLGPVHLAAASLTNAMFVQFMILGIGLSFALSPLVAAENQSGGEKKVASLLHHGSAINNIAGIILLVLLEISILLLPFLDQEERVVILAEPYIQAIAISIVPIMFFQTYRTFADGLGYVKPAMYITLMGVLFNAFFNWIFIYGNWGAPKLELVGAGLATFGSRLIMAVAMFSYIRFNKRFKKYNPGDFSLRLNWLQVKKILKIGIPSSLQTSVEVFAFTSVAVIIGWIGAFQLAAHQIALTLAAVTFMFALGISHASAIRVGTEFGKGATGNPARAGFAAVLLSAGIMAVNGILFILFRYELASFFVDSKEVVEIAANLLIIAAIFQVFDGVQAVGVGMLRGLQDVTIPTIIVIIAYWILSLPVGYVLGIQLDFGVYGVWYGFVSGLASAAIGLTTRFWLKTRRTS
jgi:MATE family multidrug resistance protein